jgi:hypothetical protein
MTEASIARVQAAMPLVIERLHDLGAGRIRQLSRTQSRTHHALNPTVRRPTVVVRSDGSPSNGPRRQRRGSHPGERASITLAAVVRTTSALVRSSRWSVW